MLTGIIAYALYYEDMDKPLRRIIECEGIWYFCMSVCESLGVILLQCILQAVQFKLYCSHTVAGIAGQYVSIILPGTISTFNLLVMKSFFAGLPEELEEAAAIDGLDTYRIFVKIILPLSKPIIATMCLFYIVTMWNEWFTPMLYLDSKDKWPIALYVRQLVEGANNTEVGSSADASSVQATLKSATMVLTSIPIICIYPFVQKYFVQGMTIGAVKGEYCSIEGIKS